MILQMSKMETNLNIFKETSSLEVVSSYIEDGKELNVLAGRYHIIRQLGKG